MSALQAVIGAVAIVAMFLLLVGPHEGGHLGFAKLFGMRVHEFSIGMGNRLLAGSRSGTLYALRLIPIGGYVRIAGMEAGDYDAPDGFHKKPAYQRLLVLLGGPLANFVMAALIMTGVYLTQLNTDPGKVVAVIKDSPAYAQGLRPGDRITTLDGAPLTQPAGIRQAEDRNPGQPLGLGGRHQDGRQFAISVTPAYDAGSRQYLIGIETARVITPLNAVTAGVSFPVVSTALIGQGFVQLLSGQVPGGFFGPEGTTGPIGIGYITYHAATEGIVSWLGIVALLSMAIGLTNLLPIPALDGGRMVVVLLEKLRGRPFDREREMAVQRAGLVALLALIALITLFDVQRLASGQFLGLR